jgi:ssDNA thymidine ADP-ribosyltransferase, DarT
MENLPHILKHGLVTANSKHINKAFRQIGDVTMIDYRKDLDAPNPPGGKFVEYILFRTTFAYALSNCDRLGGY